MPIRYGEVYYPVAYINAKATCFPHGWEYVNGGCVIQEQKEMEIFVCPQCKTAEEACSQLWLWAFDDGKQFYKEELERKGKQ